MLTPTLSLGQGEAQRVRPGGTATGSSSGSASSALCTRFHICEMSLTGSFPEQSRLNHCATPVPLGAARTEACCREGGRKGAFLPCVATKAHISINNLQWPGLVVAPGSVAGSKIAFQAGWALAKHLCSQRPALGSPPGSPGSG